MYHCFPGGSSDQILNLFGPVLDAGGNLERTEKNLQKQVWTGNQVHISAGTRDRTQDPLVQSKGRYTALLPPYIAIIVPSILLLILHMRKSVCYFIKTGIRYKTKREILLQIYQ